MGLHRSSTDKVIGGVLGGIAETYDWDPTALRVIFALASVLSSAFPGVLVYLILLILMPLE